MLTKVTDVIFQCLSRHSCQFKLQQFSIVDFHVHFCPPLWTRFLHHWLRGKIFQTYHPFSVSLRAF